MKGDYFQNISYLMIETNSSCNLKCTFCNREDLVRLGERAPKNVTLEEFRRMLSFFKDCQIDTIKLEGISEPMLHKDFHKLAEMVKEFFPDSFLIVATNLQYSLERVPFIQTLPHIDMLYLSIDGVGKTYEEARPPAKFDRLLKSLDDIKRLIPIEIRKSKLHINFTLTEFNFNELPEMYKFKENYDLASVRINLAQNWNEHEQNSRDFNPEVIDFLKKYKKDLKGVPGWDYNQCFWPFAGIIVDVFGNIRQCIINTSQKPIGNIWLNDVKEIFNNGEYYSAVRDALQANCPPTSCLNCDYKHLSPILKEIFEDYSNHDKGRNFKKDPS